ncbi:MAG TPA: hypothetical protein VGP25_21560 [Gemmatimonadaceae bacterium]|nr:hypothetical protein [Gemmatimonadaceae bacterium]
MACHRVAQKRVRIPPRSLPLSHRFFGALSLLATLASSTRALAQDASRPFSVYLDCRDFWCEPNYYRTELAFVDHMRERTAADVHILITRERTGGGGASYALAFYGQHQFAGVSDTLPLTTASGATDVETRQAVVRTIKLGLARYLARTSAGAGASLVLAPIRETHETSVIRSDPWNSWVFRIGASANTSRERNSSHNNLSGSLSANRVTRDWKTSLRVDEYYSDQGFDIDGERVTSVRRDFGSNALQVRSLNEHWSAGLRASASTSTYFNQRLALSLSPALEYDLYPYDESTRRQLTMQYSAGVKRFQYNDTTVYLRIEETRPYESMNIAFEQKQTWGSVDARANGYHFLDDLGKSRMTFSGGANLRVMPGLSISFSGNYSIIHDQLYLPKGDLSSQEVLLQQSQMATGYRAYLYAGISYTFGSMFNDVVNPRFDD